MRHLIIVIIIYSFIKQHHYSVHKFFQNTKFEAQLMTEAIWVAFFQLS